MYRSDCSSDGSKVLAHECLGTIYLSLSNDPIRLEVGNEISGAPGSEWWSKLEEVVVLVKLAVQCIPAFYCLDMVVKSELR